MRRLAPIQAPGLTAPVVRVSDLSAAGVKRWRRYGSDMVVPIRGTRARPGTDGTTWEARVTGLQLLLTEGQFLSRRTAARLLKIPLPWEPVNPSALIRFEVGAVRPRRPPEMREVMGHQVQPGVLSGLPSAPDWLPHPADAWALLAAVVGLDDLIIAGDHLISTVRKDPSPSCTFEELTGAVARFKGCPGAARMREALPQIRPGVASPPETELRLLVMRAGLPEPVTNCPVLTPERTLHADLGYPQWRIAIEYDGAYHFENGAAQAKFDTARRERMRAAGWRVLTFTSIDMRDPVETLRRISEAITEARALAR
ncbi:endonuclease domain-containing protein [Leucobacter sp. HY1908]